MELSPLAKEKLAKAGELSQEEKEKMKLSEELTSILTDFFTQKLETEALWAKLKEYRDMGKEPVIRELQSRLLHTLSLGGNDFDFERFSSAILSAETLKAPARYPEMESGLKDVKDLRTKYVKEKTEAFDAMKRKIGDQVRMAAQQIARQSKNANAAVDIESSIEASVRGSSQWREFSIKYENNYGQQFEKMLSKLEGLL